MTLEKEKALLYRPRDDSFEAYKDWLLETYEFLTGRDRAQGDTMTEEQWRDSWQRFWERAGQNAA